jgi:hypothetical protein
MRILNILDNLIYEIENPNTIIIQKNKYYKNGLKEIDIYNYYQKNKEKILKSVDEQPLSKIVIFIQLDDGRIIVRKENLDIHNNFNKVLHPRVIGLTKLMVSPTNLIVIDIDAKGDNIAEDEKKKSLLNLINLNLLNSKLYKILNSSTGYQVFFKLDKEYDIDKLRELVKNELNIKNKFNFPGIKYDLTIMSIGGNYLVENSLNRSTGLIVKNITNNWKDYKREDSILKK